MDNLSKEARSFCMSKVRNRDTDIELLVRRELRKRRIYFKCHCTTLPGSPDIVVRKHRLAVFIHGDFWHGWRFPLWRHKLSPFWQSKIDGNRRRDRRNAAKLRRMGWTVMRLWQHEIKRDLATCADRVAAVCTTRLATS